MTAYTFPKSALESARVELDRASLELFEGTVPLDLVGHVFVVAANGDFAHASPRSRGDNTPFLNGDGFVYRVTFPGGGATPTLSCKPVRTPCYLADEVVASETWADRRWAFENFGIARISIPYLGGRNFANTALVPIPPAQTGGAYRLLATYDAGRPFEIDPVTLRTVQPIGRNSDWAPTLMTDRPFPFVNASAHPIFDATTRELFSPNFVRHGSTLVRRLIRWLPGLDLLGLHSFDHLIASVASADVADAHPDAATTFTELREATKRILQMLQQMVGANPPKRATHLIRWTDAGRLDRWEIVTPEGEPVELLHSSHQIGLTRDHVILLDTVFKFEADQLWSDLPNVVERRLRRLLSNRQPSRTPVYIVKRSDLVPDVSRVEAVCGVIDAQVVHFLTNYELLDGKIVLHIVDQRSSDAAEFVADSDVQRFSPGDPIPRHAVGGLSAPMDVNGFGPVLIDPITGAHGALDLDSNADHMFGIGLMTTPDTPMAKANAPILRGIGTAHGPQPQGIDGSVFFYAHGFIPSLLSELVWDLYSDAHEPRMTPAEVTALAAAGGTAATVCRFDTITNRVVDHHTMASGEIITSPQLVPAEGSRHYLFCTVFTDDDKQIWIFDAERLQGGPLCKLRGKDQPLPWPYTLHTCWMPADLGTLSPVAVDNEADFAHVGGDPEVMAFLREHVFDKLYK